MAIQYIWNRKRTKVYVYAYKGGPRVYVHEGPRKPKRLPPDALRKIAEAEESLATEPTHLTQHLIREWRRSGDWKRLEGSTRKVWGGHLDLIEQRWGQFPYTVWNDSRMAAKVVKWRDGRAATPRAADIGVTVLRAFLKWAKLNGFVTLNVATDIPQIAGSSDREEIVWTDDDMQRFAEKAIELEREHIIDGLWLAALTGLRRADLVSLTFDHVGEFAVSKVALKKSRGRRRKATIPMTDQLATFLAEMRTRERAEGVNTVLVNSFGRPWSGDGFGGSFNRIRDAAGIAHRDAEGKDRLKHLHDVRGTFCTFLITECDLTDEEAGEVLAWSPKRVGRIRRVYVDGARVVVAIGERIAARLAKRGAKQ
jgi:integrase